MSIRFIGATGSGGGGSGISIGVTSITGGTSGNVLYDNAGIAGELTTTGSGNAVLATSPTLVTPVLGAATGTSLALNGATIGSNALAVTGNVSANALYQGTTNQAATTSIQLTASSVTSWIITGSGGQTIILPDATTLPVGAMFTFNNNQSSGAITVNVFGSGSAPATIQSGGYATVTLLTKSVAAGTWDVHYGTPSNVTWSTNTFNYPGAITGLTSASLGTAAGLTLTPTTTGLTPSIAASGTDTNISLNLVTKGTGTLQINGTALQKTNTLLFTPLSYFIAPSSTATTITVTGASWASNVATLTFTAITTAIPVGTVITVTGMTPSGYNASNVQITASSTTSVAFALITNPGAFSVGGAIGNGTTYTPSSGMVEIYCQLVGSGGGGGGGALQASGSTASGGGSGGSGSILTRFIRASDIGASQTITLGVGGTAGVAATASSTAGNSGGLSNTVSIGSIFSLSGAGGGSGGQLALISYGGGGGPTLGAATSATPTTGSVAVTFTNASTSISGTNLPTTTNLPVQFTTTGTLPTNFATGTTYYILTGATTSLITVSATIGGAAITAGSAGSGTNAMPYLAVGTGGFTGNNGTPGTAGTGTPNNSNAGYMSADGQGGGGGQNGIANVNGGNSKVGGTAGGPGGGISASAGFSGANTGYGAFSTLVTGGAVNVNGSNGILSTPLGYPGSGGGGGGGAFTGNAGNGGPGAPGGGGGGGGTAVNGSTAGTGGKGGDSFVFIVEYF